MSDDKQWAGHMRLADGPHVPLTPEECERLFNEAEAARKARAERMPDERAALLAMGEAYQRLKDLGWREAIYCPKDGSMFYVIEAGSTGIHHAHYEGQWPKGSWWIHDADDLSPSRPILFRLYPEDEAKWQAKMAELRAKFDAEREAALKAAQPGEQI
jgi:hypothetical protein